MNDAFSPDHLTGFANIAVTAGANIFIQTAVVLAAGLIAARMLRDRGPTIESMVLRVFLAGAFLCPLISLAAFHAGFSGVMLNIPLAVRGHAVQSAPVSSPVVHPAPELSSPVPVKKPEERPHEAVSSRSEAIPSSPRSTVTANPPSGKVRAVTSGLSIRRRGFTIGQLPVRTALYGTFAVLWVLCTVFMLLRLLAHYGYIMLIRRYAIPAKETFLTACAEAASDLGVGPPPVFQSPSVRSPFLAGVFRPCVFLPLGGPERAIDARTVFHHELAHLRRRDTFWNLFRHIATALVPFQPLLWIVSRRIEDTSDYACDDHASAATGNRTAYARSLVAVAECTAPSPSELTAGVGIISASPLRKRIERILDVSRAITLRISARMLVLVYSLCLSATSVAGLVGIRGRGLDQINKTSELVSRKSKEILFAAALAMNERPAATVESVPPPSEPDPAPVDTPLATESAFPAQSGITPAPAPYTAPETVADRASHESEPVPEIQTGLTPAPVSLASAAGQARSSFSFPPSVPAHTEHGVSGSTRSDPPLRTFSPDARPMLQPQSEIVAAGTASVGDLSVSSKGEAAYDGLGAYLDKGKICPVWSPDGATIAFTGLDGFGIWIVSAAGGEPALVHDNRGVWGESNMKLGGGHMRTLSFTPDGSGITFVTQVYTIKSTGTTGSGATDYSVFGTAPLIQTLNLETGRTRILAFNADDGSWAPDGTRFVFKQNVDADDCSRPGPLFILDAAGEDPRPLDVTGAYPRVTPDCCSVVYSTGGALMRVSLSGGTPEILASGSDIRNTAISPDGRRIIFSSRYGETAGRANYRLRILDIASRTVRDIATDSGLSAEMGAWSPNGKQYCFTVTRTAGTVADVIRIADFREIGLPLADTAETPAAFALRGNYPNPFNPSTTIVYSIPAHGPANLEIFNTQGQKVRVLVDGSLTAGNHSTVWNGRDDNGKTVSSGVYIARLKIEGKVESRRMTLLK